MAQARVGIVVSVNRCFSRGWSPTPLARGPFNICEHGIQLLSLGLIGEMITSLHEERADERARAQAVVDEVLGPSA